MDILMFIQLPIAIFYLFGIHLGFVIVTKKCFFEKYTFSRVVVPMLLSPSIPCLAAEILTIDLCLSFDMGEVMLGYSIFAAVIFGAAAIQLPLYIKFVKPKNSSMTAFIYLCSMVFFIYNDFISNVVGRSVFNLDSVISNIAATVAALIFYKLVIIPLSALTRVRQQRGMAAFVLIPVFAIIIRMVLYFLTGLSEVYVLDGIMIRQETIYLDNIDKLSPYITDLISAWNTDRMIYYITSQSIMLIFIASFAIIVRNVSHINMIGRQNEEIKAAHDSIKQLSVEVMEALAHTIDAKDKYTNGHSIRVAKYSRLIAEKMGLSEETCENIYYMGLLHDIGKIGVPNEIINKPTPLTDEEYEIIKTHPIIGYDILSEIKSSPELSKGARWHHERVDGKGYPDKKTGGEIPLESRIIAVADSYDAMTSNRSYRRYLPQQVVRAEIEKNSGTQFDIEAVKYMLQIIDEDKDYVLHE